MKNFRKSDLTYIEDKPVLYSELSSNGETREEIAKKLLDRCNELGKMQFTADAKSALGAEVKEEAEQQTA